MPILSGRILELRTSQNLLQQTVADDLGISLKSYQRYERGEREPSSTALIALADYFNVPIEYLVDGNVGADYSQRVVTPSEFALIEKLRALPPEKRKAVETLLG